MAHSLTKLRPTKLINLTLITLFITQFLALAQVSAHIPLLPQSLPHPQTKADTPHKSQIQVATQYSKDNLLILQVVLNRLILSEGMVGYQDKDMVFLPLGEFAKALEFNIDTDIRRGTASGWFIYEKRKFHLDINKNMVTIAGKDHPLRPEQVRSSDTDILVNIKTLEEWFPISLEFVPNTQTIQVTSRELLPVEIAMEREKKRDWLTKGAGPGKETYRQVEAPYKLASIPFMDMTYNTSYRYNPGSPNNKKGDFSHQLTSVMAGDLLYLNTNMFLLADSDQGLSEARVVMGRKDSRSTLLGPFEATEFSFGDVYSPQIPLITRNQTGRGMNLSNFPVEYTSEFDTVQLRGDIEPDWEVELYRNETLIDFQRAGADGTYAFLKVPLVAGLNIIKLVFYGPFNQQREKVYRFYMHSDLLKKGRFYYRISVNQDGKKVIPVKDTYWAFQGTEEGQDRHIVECEYGLGRQTSVTSNMVSLVLDDGHRYNYLSAGIRSSFSEIYGRVDLSKPLEASRGKAVRTSLQTLLFQGYSLTVSHDHFNKGFISEYYVYPYTLSANSFGDWLANSTSLRLNGSLPMPLRLPSLSFEVTGEMADYKSEQRNINLNSRISTFFKRIYISHNWQYTLIKGGAYGQPYQTQAGNLLLSLNWLKWSLRGDIAYDLYPDEKINSGALTSDYKLINNFSLTAGLNHQFQGEKATSYSLGLSKTYENKKYILGFNTSYADSGEYSASLSLSMSLGYEPEQKKVMLTSQSLTKSGTVEARVFLDENQNGKFDEGDVLLPEARVGIDKTTQKESTNDQGIAWLPGISPYKPVGITVDSASLEDPYWALAEKGIDVITRPGVPVCLDFPVLATGEIEGTVYLVNDKVNEKVNDNDKADYKDKADVKDKADDNEKVNDNENDKVNENDKADVKDKVNGKDNKRKEISKGNDKDSKRKETSNVELELIDQKGKAVKKIKTAFDGYYIFELVPLGSYTLRVSEEQIKRLNLKPVNAQKVTLTRESPTVSGVEFVLEHDLEHKSN